MKNVTIVLVVMTVLMVGVLVVGAQDSPGCSLKVIPELGETGDSDDGIHRDE